GHEGDRRAEDRGQGDQRGPGARRHRGRVEAGEDQFPLAVPREHRRRFHPRLRPRRSAGRARAVRRQPAAQQHHPARSGQGHHRRGARGRPEVARAGESHDDRSRSGREHEMKARGARGWALGAPLLGASLLVASSALAQVPAVGAEKPFQVAPRVEKTLPNGLRVIVTRQTVVPKVTVGLTILSGYSSGPADLTGLAALTADAVQEGTKARTSKEIRRDVFGMGGSLTAAVSQDFSQLSVRGLSEFAPKLIDLVAEVATSPTLPADEIAIL